MYRDRNRRTLSLYNKRGCDSIMQQFFDLQESKSDYLPFPGKKASTKSGLFSIEEGKDIELIWKNKISNN